MTLVLQQRTAALKKAEPRASRVKKRPVKSAKPPSSTLSLPGGRISGQLTGSYTFADEAFRRAGMLVIVAPHSPFTASSLIDALPLHLHFLSFAFRLPPAGGGGDSGAQVDAWADDLYEVLRWLTLQHPQLLVRAIVGLGGAADVCNAYACKYGDAASCPTRMLVQVGGSHGAVGDWPTGGWRVLSIVGAADATERRRAELYHTRHQHSGHRLRLLEGEGSGWLGSSSSSEGVSSTINDWIEGARRLNGDDAAAWASAPATREEEVAVEGPPVGSMEKVVEIQLECLADDLAVRDHMAGWSEERLRRYFESGGETS